MYMSDLVHYEKLIMYIINYHVMPKRHTSKYIE